MIQIMNMYNNRFIGQSVKRLIGLILHIIELQQPSFQNSQYAKKESNSQLILVSGNYLLAEMHETGLISIILKKDQD
ncbi:hypothetical protein FGO68_gene4361 [Halteria grandinella]|uniref:Uncharacterized protein n=1 Tax=Halteria grandinella TaxID=5974 RepID=A0A8J8NGZ6_HALGN|nr:hypothetical protein FGO68_gene4361 [Halteria grandinella]